MIIDHEEILRAVERRDIASARAAMALHITRLIDDVELYWEQVFSNSETATPQVPAKDANAD